MGSERSSSLLAVILQSQARGFWLSWGSVLIWTTHCLERDPRMDWSPPVIFSWLWGFASVFPALAPNPLTVRPGPDCF